MSLPSAPHRIDRNELLRSIDLERVLDSLSGPAERNRRWHCPDLQHPDHHPSVTVTTGHDGIQRWRCWSGGHHGTAIDAVMAAHRLTAGEAIRWLVERHTNLPPPPPRPPLPERLAGESSIDVVEYVQRAEKLLWTAAGRPQRDWLHARGLDEDILRANRVGADPGRRYLPRPKGFPAGWPAVVYPALSPGGTITYFQARYLDPPAGRGKYDNPSRTHATNPRLSWTRLIAAADTRTLLVTEGIPDALMAAQAGIQSVAVLGSTLPDRTIATDLRDVAFARRVERIVICFDADDAGRRGAAALRDLLDGEGVAANVIEPPNGLDLSEWMRTAECRPWLGAPACAGTPPVGISGGGAGLRDGVQLE